MGAVALAPPSVVAPHEATEPSVVADRRALRAATCADLEPVVFAHDGLPGPAAALARRVVAERTPVADLTDDAGVRHRLWRVADPAEIAVVRADFARRRAVIADGHHRWAAAAAQRDHAAPAAAPAAAVPGAVPGTVPGAVPPAAVPGAVPGAAPGAAAAGVDGTPAGRVLALVVPVGEHGPQVRGRSTGCCRKPRSIGWTTDASGVPRWVRSTLRRLELLATTVAPVVVATDGERWLRLTDPDAEGVTPEAWQGLDVALVDVLLVGERPTVLLRHSVAAAVAEARRIGGVALLVRATATATVLELAGRGVLMPRKSTFFVPKPRTGLVLRCFADQR